jgi:hypothetical protein
MPYIEQYEFSSGREARREQEKSEIETELKARTAALNHEADPVKFYYIDRLELADLTDHLVNNYGPGPWLWSGNRLATRRNTKQLLGDDTSVYNLCKVSYVIVRGEKFFNFMLPEFSPEFDSITKINEYVVDNPDSLMATCLDLAIQMHHFIDDNNYDVKLSVLTINQLKNNKSFQNLIRDVSLAFFKKLGSAPLGSFIANNAPIYVPSEAILPFNYKSKDQQPKIDKNVRFLVRKCRTRHEAIPAYNIQISIQHIIKECIEVLSWIERKANELTFIYYENRLPDALKYVPGVIRNMDTSYFPGNTIFYNRESIRLPLKVRSAFDGTTVTQDALLADPRPKKVYISLCYGARGDKFTGENFESMVNYFIDEMGVLPANIHIYLGPVEDANETQARSQEIERDQLFAWLLSNSNFIREKRVKLIIYDARNLTDEYLQLPAFIWHLQSRYLEAEKYVIQELLTENKKFGTQLAEAASGYFSQKEREVARQGVNEVSAERRMRPGS